MSEPKVIVFGTKKFQMVLSTPAICDFEDAMSELQGGKRYNFSELLAKLMAPSFTELANLIRAVSWRQSEKKRGLTVDYVKEAMDEPDAYKRGRDAIVELFGERFLQKEAGAGEEPAAPTPPLPAS